MMKKRKRKMMRWSFSAYDPYTDQQVFKLKNLTENQFDIAVKEFRNKFK